MSGECAGKLWYKFESQRAQGGSVEDGGLAWCFAAYDVDNLKLITRNPSVPQIVHSVQLPRIKVCHGAHR
jgi:hypothetical protein